MRLLVVHLGGRHDQSAFLAAWTERLLGQDEATETGPSGNAVEATDVLVRSLLLGALVCRASP